MTSTTLKSWLFYAGIGLAAAPLGWSCGPDFPNAYLANSLDELTTLPTLSFERELDGIIGGVRRAEPADMRDGRLADAERAEVRDELLRQKIAPELVRAAVATYRRDAPPITLPAEFQLYARGARAWHRGRCDEALAAWRELLALPPEQRRYRTTWAWYMIGRAQCDAAPQEAIEAFDLAIQAARDGFADSQELADAAPGWKARAYVQAGAYRPALQLYLGQYANGDSSARASIQLTLRRAFSGTAIDRGETDDGCDDAPPAPNGSLQSLASDAQIRQVVTAWFAARGGPGLAWGRESESSFRRWIGCLSSTAKLTPAEADRWCWVAYQNGLWTEAHELAARAPATAPASEWVRAMLLLRGGFVEEAVEHLSVAARSFAIDRGLAGSEENLVDAPTYLSVEGQPLGDGPAAHLGGVRGVLALRSERYTEALRIFMRSGHWADAAYVAERVLTLPELEAYVRQEYWTDCRAPWAARRDALDLRHLLARRLVRAGRFDDAETFFPPTVQGDFRKYVENVRIGWNQSLPTATRAIAFWTAAQLLHEHGMEFEGTELEPDFAMQDGEYTWPRLASLRLGGMKDLDAEPETLLPASRNVGPMAPSDNERERVKAAKVPARRFHYRYRAAELAWLAAALLPNDDDRTADVLHTAGRWLANRDPELANPYFQTLVLRCPNTALGRRAAERHWFVRE